MSGAGLMTAAFRQLSQPWYVWERWSQARSCSNLRLLRVSGSEGSMRLLEPHHSLQANGTHQHPMVGPKSLAE